ncbi:MAG TPA: (Fe-S)-binding protein [Polyangia bacterium]|nr:(Fe-S)-binding protein [Polyangia bacterium]
MSGGAKPDAPVARSDSDQAGWPSFEAIATCVHCGLCLEACPTYRELRLEADSPRGRIYLMKGLRQQSIAPTPEVLRHLDQCLDCRACETACPSGVPYAEILERTRAALQPARPSSPPGRFLRWFAFSVLLPHRWAQWLVFKVLWLQQALGLTRLGRWLGRRRLLPGRLSAAAVQAPVVGFRSFRSAHASARGRGLGRPSGRGVLFFPARGPAQRRVAFHTGCLADQLFASVNEATVRVLTENGCDVDVIGGERCCGALHIHNGARDQAKELARATIAAFAAAGPHDAIVSSAAGCSAELRHYGALLDGDPAAVAFGAKVRDVAEYLCAIGFRAPEPTSAAPAMKVAYDEPCHLLHAQKISDPPKQILRAIPGVTLVPLDDADACCGSAGIYSLLQPALSARIAARKIDAIKRSGADVVATGNPGCLMQIRAGVDAAGLRVRVAHPVALLAEAYARR